jgi:ATP-binding cassette subfamily B protein
MSRMTNDIDNISMAVTQSITSFVSGILTILGCFVIMLYYSPLLMCVALITLVLSTIFTLLMSKFMRPLFVKQSRILGLLNSQTEEMVTGCKTVIAYNHQDEAEEEFNDYSNELCKTAINAQIWGGSMGPIMNFVGNVGYFLICLFGAIFLIEGIGNGLFGNPLEPAVVITFLTLNKQFTRPINEIAQLYSSLLTAMAGAERVFTMMDEEVENFTGEIPFDPNTTTGYIDFQHVGFGYVPGKTVLKDFNVDVYSGHKIALVGATGSGKTTIVNLLLRFYDIDSGKILIDNKDINQISKKDLRDCISIVLQDAVLFGDTVENNVKYGKQDATQEEFENALKMANCYNFVQRLPQKEKTILSEGATNISQGQRQLLTIARAILANPKILILDEATSSVDTRTEKKIQDALVKLMANRTSIIIAHRLSTIQDADLIVVLDQGVVVEMGDHKELIQKGGVYNKLYQTQFAGLDT